MAKILVSSLIFTLFVFQVSQGQQQQQVIKDYIVKKLDQALKDLVNPLTSEMTKLNETIVDIQQKLAVKQAAKLQLKLLALAEKNATTNNNGSAVIKVGDDDDDKCKDLIEYLPEAQQVVEKAFYMSTDITGALSGVLIDSLNCLQINVFRAVACFVKSFAELRQVYTKYEPELLPIFKEIKQMLTKLLSLYVQCFRDL